MIVDCLYKIDDESQLLGCASAFDEEQAEAIANAFRQVVLTIEVDEDWGFCKLIAVNGSSIE